MFENSWEVGGRLGPETTVRLNLSPFSGPSYNLRRTIYVQTYRADQKIFTARLYKPKYLKILSTVFSD